MREDLHGRAVWLRMVLQRRGAVLAPRDRDALVAVSLHPGRDLAWFGDPGSVPGITGPRMAMRIRQLARQGAFDLVEGLDGQVVVDLAVDGGQERGA